MGWAKACCKESGKKHESVVMEKGPKPEGHKDVPHGCGDQVSRGIRGREAWLRHEKVVSRANRNSGKWRNCTKGETRL